MQLRPLGDGFGAEVQGLGLADVVARDQAYAAVRDAFETHSVLLFRDQAVDDELQAAFSRRFGPLETATPASLGEGTPFTILTNIDPATGALAPHDGKEALRALANQLWHTDSCFKSPPALASVLSARVIPVSGGETEFASMRRAWERLPEGRRAQLAGAYAWHDYAHSRSKIAPHLASDRERNRLPPVCWRMTWRDPANGRVAALHCLAYLRDRGDVRGRCAGTRHGTHRLRDASGADVRASLAPGRCGHVGQPRRAASRAAVVAGRASPCRTHDGLSHERRWPCRDVAAPAGQLAAREGMRDAHRR